MNIELNPKVKDFLEENKDKRLVSFAWSLYWRLWVVIFGLIVGAYLLVAIVDTL